MVQPYLTKKCSFWDTLRQLTKEITYPWLVIGDLNEVLTLDEKVGDHSIGTTCRNHLANILLNTNFTDLGFRGNPHTWRNNRHGLHHIRWCFDRTIANENCRINCSKAIVTHLPAINSSYIPILLKRWHSSHLKTTPFRFEAAWIRDPINSIVVQ